MFSPNIFSSFILNNLNIYIEIYDIRKFEIKFFYL